MQYLGIISEYRPNFNLSHTSPPAKAFHRLICYPYRYREVPLAPLGPIKDKSKIIKHRNYNTNLACRSPCMVSLGVNVSGIAQPHPDMNHGSTMEAGVRKRFLHKPPLINVPMMDKIKDFTINFCKNELKPLDPNVDTSVEYWLKTCNYPKWRKDELAELWKLRSGQLNKKDFRVKSFIKDETYPEYKHARGINSRSDMFKCAVGPIFHLIEKEVFKLPYFIKKIPVSERPEFIRRQLERIGARYGAADYTAFEAHFSRLVMESIEFILYDFMTSLLPEHTSFMKLIRKVLAGTNVCIFKYLTVICEATRMSGEMCTSLGNGFANLILLKFIFHEMQREVALVVEGDDSAFRIDGIPPTVEDFKNLGFTIKLELYENLNEVSFCGLVFDTKYNVVVTDVRDALSTFGWASSSYCSVKENRLLQLLRCKSLSYAHQYPGCPILGALAQYGLRCTRSINVKYFIENERSLSLWDREQLRSALSSLGNGKVPYRNPPYETRILVSNLYGITPCQQIACEEYLFGLTKLQELSGPIIEIVNNPKWIDYFKRYSWNTINRHDLLYPRFRFYNTLESEFDDSSGYDSRD
jgi:hypothetical protein